MSWSDPAHLRRNNLDLLRLLLACGVIYSHSFVVTGQSEREPLRRWTNHHIGLGALCVFGFFLLSGFLITASWDRSRSTATYFWHRFLRIVPAFFVMTMMTIFLFIPLGSEPNTPWSDFTRF